jgi:hypothetical protein
MINDQFSMLKDEKHRAFKLTFENGDTGKHYLKSEILKT